MSRLDHCFLFAGAGERAMAFCPADDFDRPAATELVQAALERFEEFPEFDLAYLGVLDYQEMDPRAGGMLEPFEKLGPVWLVRFRWTEAAPTGPTDAGGARG